jgi:hypothetical protein
MVQNMEKRRAERYVSIYNEIIQGYDIDLAIDKDNKYHFIIKDEFNNSFALEKGIPINKLTEY